MISRTITVERATPQNIAEFGAYIGAHPAMTVFAGWEGVTVYGAIPIEIGSGGELLFAETKATRFPATIALLERHFEHTQTYLAANGRPFVMVLGAASTDEGLPDILGLKAFLFEDSAGIAMKAGIWHEFPLALEDDTRFAVLLRQESHVNLLESPVHQLDARGPDLERYDMQLRAQITVQF
jgi:ureidoglycolate lyase